MAWLSVRTSSLRPEEGKGRCGSAPHLRFAPAPCCSRDKRGGSITINTANGLWRCFGCQRSGNWYGLTRLYGQPLSDPYEAERPVDFSAYDRVRAAMRRPAAQGHHPELLAYCRSRGLSASTLNAWRVSTKGAKALRWPLFARDDDGAWRMANARIRVVLDRDKAEGSVDWFEVKGGPTMLAFGNHLLGLDPLLGERERPSWLRDWLVEGEEEGDPTGRVKRVLLTEGQWDAMTAYQLGIPNVLSLAGGAGNVDVSGLFRYVPDTAEVWLAVDMDEAGDKAAESVFAQLGPDRVKRLKLPHKDLNDWLKAVPDLTAEDVLATVRGYGESQEEARASAWLDLSAAPADLAREGIVCETPWPRLTTRLGGGLKEGQTTGILAPSGYGKTSVANNIVAEAAKTVKVGVIQLEGSRQTVAQAVRRHVEGWVKPDLDEMLPPILRRVMISPLEGKGVTWKRTIEEASRMVDEGARLLVMDNWDFIIPPTAAGSGEKMKAYAALQELVRKTGVHAVVVWQPNKVDRGEVVNSGHQKGLSNALQDADVYLTLNKFGLVRRLDVEKVRGVVEKEGMASQIWLKFDPERSSLFETESQAQMAPLDDWKL